MSEPNLQIDPNIWQQPFTPHSLSDKPSDKPSEALEVAGAPKKRARTKTGCFSCRGRRIKCGEERPLCSHCKRLGIECIWTNAALPLAQEKTEQKRSLTACGACREARARCSHDRPLCTRCARKGIPCDFPAPKRMLVASTTSEHITSNSSSGSDVGLRAFQAPHLPPIEDRLVEMANDSFLAQHFDAYFTYVAPVSWHGFLHKRVMYRRLEGGTVPRMLLLAICAVTSTFVSTSESAATQAEAWSREVKYLMMDSLNVPHLATLSATLLVIQFEEARGRTASVWTILGMAVRQAYALQLNVESPDESLSWAEREGRRRLMWACYCLDKFAGGGILDVMHVSDASLKIQLPCQDINYDLEISCVTPTITEATSSFFSLTSVPHGHLGLSAHYFLLIYVRARVLRFRRNHTSYHRAPWETMSEFELCLSALETWRNSLPPEMVFEASNIHDYAARSELSAFLSLHMWATQSACDMVHIVRFSSLRLARPANVLRSVDRRCLVSFSVVGFSQEGKNSDKVGAGFVELPSPTSLSGATPDWIAGTRATCAQKAAQVADLFATVLQEVPDFVSGDIGVSTCAFQSVRIQIEWVMLASAAERPRRRAAAVPRFEATLRIVRAMNGLFPCVNDMYIQIAELLWKHGYAEDLPAVHEYHRFLVHFETIALTISDSSQFPGPPPASQFRSMPRRSAGWAPTVPASALQRPESNVRDAIGNQESPSDGVDGPWPEDLPENAEWNYLAYNVQATEVRWT
ncbi:hypothetical protein P7C70_g1513, partial [Phenoliferia sp. Uapishka_3]